MSNATTTAQRVITDVNMRHRRFTVDGTGPFTFADLMNANDHDIALASALTSLRLIGHHVTFGGGAAASFLIERVENDTNA